VRPPERSARSPTRVLLTTEGTYPYALGGVSSWCDLIIRSLTEIEWRVLPITAGPRPRAPAFQLPAHASLAGVINLWSSELPPARIRPARLQVTGSLPGVLARELLGWDAGPDALVDALVRCRRNPGLVRPVFRSSRGWKAFLTCLRSLVEEQPTEAGSVPTLDVLDAATLYQTLYWVARTAARPAPAVDLVHVTAAGWSCIPAIVSKALHGTPVLLTEHGVYVREAYLAEARARSSAGARFLATRLARGLARAAYRAADLVAPVTDANSVWERQLGVEPGKIRVIYNGVDLAASPATPPAACTVVSIGRIDPLKDLHTMLRVASEVVRRVPSARFLHYGPVTAGEEAYERSCHALHEELRLGDSFRFMGATSDPEAVLRAADVALMTSISEGLPLSVLEALAQARPVVATCVGGVADVVRGCGLVAPPGDAPALASAVCTLLRDPAFSALLGRRGYARVQRRFTRGACASGYRTVLAELAGTAA
jgi:glycosyltransferase involved in cell wall biosynthesis